MTLPCRTEPVRSDDVYAVMYVADAFHFIPHWDINNHDRRLGVIRFVLHHLVQVSKNHTDGQLYFLAFVLQTK